MNSSRTGSLPFEFLVFSCFLIGCLADGSSPVDDPAIPCAEDTIPAIRLGGIWTERVSGTTKFIGQVTWIGDRYVAAGDFDSILTSSDGTAWEKIGISGTLNALAWNGGSKCSLPASPLVVGVGKNGVILTSPDGVVWSAQLSGTTNTLNAVVWTGTQFVAVGTGGAILTSSNGLVWIPRVSSTAGTLWDVASGDSMIVAVGATILSSPDGVTWTTRNTENNKGNGLIWVVAWDDGFTAVNPGMIPLNSGYTVSSVDGTTWTTGISSAYPKPQRFGRQYVIAGEYTDVLGEARIYVSPIAEGDQTTQSIEGGNFSPAGTAWNGSRFVVVGSGGNIWTLP